MAQVTAARGHGHGSTDSVLLPSVDVDNAQGPRRRHSMMSVAAAGHALANPRKGPGQSTQRGARNRRPVRRDQLGRPYGVGRDTERSDPRSVPVRHLEAPELVGGTVVGDNLTGDDAVYRRLGQIHSQRRSGSSVQRDHPDRAAVLGEVSGQHRL
jgi:hypothetical protein